MENSLQLENYSVRLLGLEQLEEALAMLVQRFMPSRIFVLVDENTYSDCWSRISHFNLLKSAIPLEIESGEESKNLSTCEQLWAQLVEAGADRHSLLINLGGGVIGDMGGFVGSTFMRGLPFVQLPTTLLSMVDASVGGKLGVDFQGLKNMIGLFGDPAEVIICPEFLETLPERELRSGMAEVFKHALIADAGHWEELRNFDFLKADKTAWYPIIRKSVSIKRDVVQEDREERGKRKILNFGHSVGHAVESWALESKRHQLLHGEAVAIGMVCEAWVSQKKLGLSDEGLNEVIEVLSRCFVRRNLNELEAEKFLGNLTHDKKNIGGELQFSLLRKIGDCAFDITVKPDMAWKAVEYYKENYAI